VPDRRKHRGPHPEDVRLFAPETHAALRRAVADLCWLLSRRYAQKSALKLVGDRYGLVARQRVAVGRCACGDADRQRRRAHQAAADQLPGRPLWLDGYNVLTTIEAALSGGFVLAACDGAYRDMASMHGSYRKVAETRPALQMIGHVIASTKAAESIWFLDRPVSNSGRLKAVIEEVAAVHGWRWRVELVPDPDVVLSNAAETVDTDMPPAPAVVASADSVILDRCEAWFNLARETISRHVPEANVVSLVPITDAGDLPRPDRP